jgi:hypothetical protein
MAPAPASPLWAALLAALQAPRAAGNDRLLRCEDGKALGAADLLDRVRTVACARRARCGLCSRPGRARAHALLPQPRRCSGWHAP